MWGSWYLICQIYILLPGCYQIKHDLWVGRQYEVRLIYIKGIASGKWNTYNNYELSIY